MRKGLLTWVFWAKIPLGGWKGYVIDDWQSYACARVTPIKVWVVIWKNESNCLLENKMVTTLIWRHVRLVIVIVIITLFNEGRDIDYWSPSSFHNGPPTIKDYCMLFSQTFDGLLLSYLTITDVTWYVHHKFPVSFLLYIATKKLN